MPTNNPDSSKEAISSLDDAVAALQGIKNLQSAHQTASRLRVFAGPGSETSKPQATNPASPKLTSQTPRRIASLVTPQP